MTRKATKSKILSEDVEQKKRDSDQKRCQTLILIQTDSLRLMVDATENASHFLGPCKESM